MEVVRAVGNGKVNAAVIIIFRLPGTGTLVT